MKPVLLTIFFVLNLQAKSEFLNHLPCAEQVYSHVEALGEPLKWGLVKQNVVSSKLKEDGVVKLSVIGRKTLIESSAKDIEISGYYIEPACALKITKLSEGNNGFTDLDLNKLLKKSDSGIIYVWSPHMSLSVFELVEMKNYAQKLNVDFTVLMDFNADLTFSKKVVSEHRLPLKFLKKMNSRKLESFGVNIHYPSMVLYKNGKLLKRIPGFNGEKEFKRLIKKHL